MNTKIIFIDIDGTLLSHTQGISPKSLEAILRARENGHLVFLNTGRAKSYSQAFLKLPVDGFVFGAGAHVEIDGKTLYNLAINHDDMTEIIKLLKNNSLILVFEGSEKSYFSDEALKFFEKIYEKRQLENNQKMLDYHVGKEIFNDLDNYLIKKTPVNKMTIYFQQHDEYKFLKDFLHDRYHFIMYDKAAEVVVKGVNKFKGIEEVCAYYKIPIENTIAFGDSYNDYEMIKFAGVGVAMANSHPDILELADLVTDSVDNDGIYWGFKKLGLI